MARKRPHKPSQQIPSARPAPSPPRHAGPAVAPPSRAPVADAVVGIGSLTGGLAVLLMVGLHLAFRVGPALCYQQSAPAFFVDAPFFARFRGVPGGLLQYTAAALAQLNCRDGLGALAFTVVMAGVLAGAWRVFARVEPRGAMTTACGLVVLVAALPGRYEGDPERTALGILIALAGACLWSTLRARSLWPRVALGWGVATGVFCLAGTLPAALCTTLIVLDSVWVRRSPPLALGCASVFLVVGTWVAYHPGFRLFPGTREWGQGITWFLHLAAYLFVPVWQLIRAARRQGGTVVSSNVRERLFAGALGLGVATLLLGMALDAPRRSMARLGYHAGRQEWAQALEAAGRLRDQLPHARDWPATARIQLARVLHHAGHLPEALFSFPQRAGEDLLPGYDAGLAMGRAEAQALLELGQVNLAEHMAHESLELDGALPDTLLLLARVNTLKDRPGAARIFLNRLGLAPFHRAEAEHELQSLEADPAGSHMAGLTTIRARMPRTDEPDPRLSTEALLLQLLRSNPTNRMAYDFLLAHRLLNGQLEELAYDVAHLEGFRDTPLARPCEEALVLHRDTTPTYPTDLQGRKVRPETLERYRRFKEAIQRYADRQTAAVALADEFGDTYWYFARFGETAAVRTNRTSRPPT